MLMIGLSACGGGGGFDGNPPPPGGGGPAIASITLLASGPQLGSGAATQDQGVTLTAITQNSANTLVEGVPVSFAASSGALQVTRGTTDASGAATAILTTAGNPENRTITVTATAGGTSTTITVDVTGTQLAVSGPDTLTINDTATYSIALTNSAGTGIANQMVTVASAIGNTLSSVSLTTDASGQVQVNVTGTIGGLDTLTVSALGLTRQFSINVSTDNFTFTTPPAGTRVALSTTQPLTLHWDRNGLPQIGQPISFSTTRGILSAEIGSTDANGNLTISISSVNAGPAVISAVGPGGLATDLEINFIATNPDTLTLMAEPSTVVVNAQSTVTAVVRDPADNLVEGRRVNFTLNDVSGGSLSSGFAVTDSQGKASVIYTAGASTSASNAVTITAVVDGTAIQDTTNLTVAGQQLRVTLGTGNTLFEPNATQYRVPYVVQVTDANGNPVSGNRVQLNVRPLVYFKGFWRPVMGRMPPWERVPTLPAPMGAPPGFCDNEDINFNGINEAGEDFNNNGVLDPGNPVTVSPGMITTDAEGFGFIDVVYPQSMATWVSVRLSAIIEVTGTEFTESRTFDLAIAGSDISDINVAPPGDVSPFGSADSCADPN